MSYDRPSSLVCFISFCCHFSKLATSAMYDDFYLKTFFDEGNFSAIEGRLFFLLFLFELLVSGERAHSHFAT